MKLKNLSIATIILLLIGLGFSSCDSDRYRWMDGTLDGGTTVFTNRNGDALGLFKISAYDVVLGGSGSRYATIEDVKFVGGYIRLGTDIREVQNLNLRIEGTDIGITFPIVSEYMDYDNRRVQDFLFEVVREIQYRGSANIVVEGVSRYSDIRLDVDIYMDVDAYVRD